MLVRDFKSQIALAHTARGYANGEKTMRLIGVIVVLQRLVGLSEEQLGTLDFACQQKRQQLSSSLCERNLVLFSGGKVQSLHCIMSTRGQSNKNSSVYSTYGYSEQSRFCRFHKHTLTLIYTVYLYCYTVPTHTTCIRIRTHIKLFGFKGKHLDECHFIQFHKQLIKIYY